MKHRTPRSIAALISISALLFAPLLSFAATDPVAPAASQFPKAPYEPFVPKAGDTPEPSANPDLKSCFEYYRFGSTPIVLSSELSRVAQGATVAFTGRVTNENAYPVSDLAISVKVFHRRNPAVKDSFGPDVVDWFTIADKVNLAPGEVMPLKFDWKVPVDAPPGQYAMATFVVSHDRFNLSGLSFTTDIVGSSYEFSVDGGTNGSAQFDITRTTVGDQVLHAATFAPRFSSPDDSVPVTLYLANSSGSHFAGTVKWTLYAWDRNLAQNLIDTKEVPVSVDGKGEIAVPFAVQKSGHSVYNLIAELTPALPSQTKSFVSVRFITDEVNDVRLNFTGASKYPADTATDAFACFHATGMAPAENVKVEMVARSTSFFDGLLGKAVLAEKSFEGTAPGNIVAISAPFSRASDSYTVTAKLYQGGKLIDTVQVPYCKDGCSSAETPSFASIIVQIVVFVFMTMGILELVNNPKRTPPPAKQVPPASTPPAQKV